VSISRAVHHIVFIAALLISVGACYLLATPFLQPVGWAVTLAILFFPLHMRIESKLKNRDLAAFVSVSVVALIVVLPTFFVGQRLAHEAVAHSRIFEGRVPSVAMRHSVETIMERYHIDLSSLAGAGSSWVTSLTTHFVVNSTFQILGLVLIFYFLFYCLRDRVAAIGFLRRVSPLEDSEMDRLLSGVVDTVHATALGTLAMAIVQGVLGGLMFWWLGLSAPVLWGVIMGLLAIVPVLGAFVVWVPAAGFLILTGAYTDAVILAVWGIGVVGTIDNFLYPMVVGHRLGLHTVLAFIAMISGMMLFGSIGIILGPVILTVTQCLLVFADERGELASQSQVPTPESTQ